MIAPENMISRGSFFVLRFKKYIYLQVVVSSSLPDSPKAWSIEQGTGS